jgi:hypothetical protein
VKPFIVLDPDPKRIQPSQPVIVTLAKAGVQGLPLA